MGPWGLRRGIGGGGEGWQKTHEVLYFYTTHVRESAPGQTAVRAEHS